MSSKTIRTDTWHAPSRKQAERFAKMEAAAYHRDGHEVAYEIEPRESTGRGGVKFTDYVVVVVEAR